jgi:hypothetical protein
MTVRQNTHDMAVLAVETNRRAKDIGSPRGGKEESGCDGKGTTIQSSKEQDW